MYGKFSDTCDNPQDCYIVSDSPAIFLIWGVVFFIVTTFIKYTAKNMFLKICTLQKYFSDTMHCDHVYKFCLVLGPCALPYIFTCTIFAYIINTILLKACDHCLYNWSGQCKTWNSTSHLYTTIESNKTWYFALRIRVKYCNWSTTPIYLRFLSTCIWKFVFSSFRSTVQCKLACCIHAVAQQDTYILSSLNIFIPLSPHWVLLWFAYYIWTVWSCEASNIYFYIQCVELWPKLQLNLWIASRPQILTTVTWFHKMCST